MYSNTARNTSIPNVSSATPAKATPKKRTRDVEVEKLRQENEQLKEKLQQQASDVASLKQRVSSLERQTSSTHVSRTKPSKRQRRPQVEDESTKRALAVIGFLVINKRSLIL